MKTPTLRVLALTLAAAAAGLAVVALALLLRSLRQPPEKPEAASAPPVVRESAAPSEALQTPPGETAGPEPARAPQPDADVQAAFDAFLAAQGGTWDLRYESLTTGAFAAAQSGHETEPGSVAASVIKLFVMGAVYDAVEAGTLTHDAVLADLRGMITQSDNSACNRLVTQLGAGSAQQGMDAVNRFAAALGCADTRMNRLMLQPGPENYVSAKDCAIALRQIYSGACVSKEASSEMLELLLAQTVNDRIPAALPPGTPVAHKTGNLANLSCGDVGIVFAPNGDYILCAISNHAQNDTQATEAIAAISRTVYDLVTGA